MVAGGVGGERLITAAGLSFTGPPASSHTASADEAMVL